MTATAFEDIPGGHSRHITHILTAAGEPTTAPTSGSPPNGQGSSVGAVSSRWGHGAADAHVRSAPPQTDPGQSSCDRQDAPAGVADVQPDQASIGAQGCRVGPDADRQGQARLDTQSMSALPLTDPGQQGCDAQGRVAGVANGQGHFGLDLQTGSALPEAHPGQVERDAHTLAAGVFDPLLALLADALDDLERTRIANENRLRQLTRTQDDADGEQRGFGLPADHPVVARLTGIVDALAAIEHKAELALARQMRAHPLGGWVKATVGVGEKQAARLLAAVGDPYLNLQTGRPRTVSQLWAYAGLHVFPAAMARPTPTASAPQGSTIPAVQVGQPLPVTQGITADLDQSIPAAIPEPATIELTPQGPNLPADQSRLDIQRSYVGGEQSGGHPDHGRVDAHRDAVGVAARRAKGQRANWSSRAKSRAWLVAVSCVKQERSPYRAVYDLRRGSTADRLHRVACVRCGPAGKPAAAGTRWSAGHRHADALRIVSKEILKDLWREARAYHLDPATDREPEPPEDDR